MPDLRLVIWDVDGTLANSRAAVAACMRQAFASAGMDYPGDARALEGVGLSLMVLFARMVPDATEKQLEELAAGYRAAYAGLRTAEGVQDLSPLFDGVRPVLDHLRTQDWTLQAVATGKSKRGLDAFVAGHQFDGYFMSQQVADFHPSKPHPAMVQAAMDDAGVPPTQAVMIGDTTFDMEMGRAAGARTIGVSWGYHPVERLDADVIVSDPAQLISAIDGLLT